MNIMNSVAKSGLRKVAPRPMAVMSASLIVIAAGIARADAGLATKVIFRCEIDGVVTFSDRPCGAEAQEYTTDTNRVSSYQAVPVRPAGNQSRQAQPRKRSAARDSAARNHARHLATCAKVTAGLADVRSKMRAGYKTKDGDRLKARQAKLRQQARTERCR